MLQIARFGLILMLIIPTNSYASSSSCAYYSSEGAYYEKLGDTESAVKSCELAATSDKSCFSALTALGRLYAGKKEWKKAEKALSKAIRLRPQFTFLKFRLAECYFAQEKYTWALRTLQGMACVKPDCDESYWYYLMGKTALEMGDPNAGGDYFDRIPEKDKASFPVLAYYRARAHAEAGEPGPARESLDLYFNNGERDRSFDEAARWLLERTYAGQEKTPFFSFAFSHTILYDTNVIQEPDDKPQAGGMEPDSFGVSLFGWLGFFPVRTAHHLFGVELSGSGAFHFEEPAMEFNYYGVSVTPRYRYKYRAMGFDQELHLAYAGSLALLNGGPELAEEESLYVYSESHGARAKWIIHESGFGATSLRTSFDRRMYHHFARDTWGGAVNANQVFFFLNDRLKLFLEPLGRYEKARLPEYDRWGIGGFVGLSSLMIWKLSGALWLRYERLDHFNSENEHRWEKARKDHLIKLGASLSLAVTDESDIGVSYDFTHNKSTVSPFTYTRHTVMLRRSWRFAW